jgi:CRISPR/Cas system CSM-associated protein Csm3 (group 7 of RAMP superfamily)
MHKKLLNEANFSLTISVTGPLLVKSGVEGWDPTIPDMQFVRTLHRSLGDTVYIPGSSIKGPIRAYAEKIANTLGVRCCDLFDKKNGCGFSDKITKDAAAGRTAAVYRQSCTACKVFGSTNIAGRAAFQDAYPTTRINPATQLTKRTAVAIDRVLGSVAQGPFDFEALTTGDLKTSIVLRNFELWQFGLLGLALRDLCLGRVRIGYGKSRGFGNIAARIDKLEIRSPLDDSLIATSDGLVVKGVSALVSSDAERREYGLEDPQNSTATIKTSLSPLDDLIGKAIVFERPIDSADWSTSETQALFTECVRSAWTAYRTHANGRPS